MIFALDVGNTNIVLGVFGDDYNMIHSWRIATDNTKTEDELYVIIRNFFVDKNIKFEDFDGVVISSVVPKMMFALELLSKKYFKKDPIVVSTDINTGIKVPAPYSSKLGADRVVDIVGAKVSSYLPAIVVDFGTATTYCAVSKKGEYIGGAISPGMKISSEALFQKASKLPRVELVTPETVICKDTVSAMQAGIIYGYAGQVEKIVGLMKKELKDEGTLVIATGGLANMISQETNAIDVIDPNLTLEGLRIIYEKNI